MKKTIIMISGIPACGKTTLANMIRYKLEKEYGLRVSYIFLTGYHMITYIFFLFLLMVVYRKNFLHVIRHYVKKYRRNPTDMLPYSLLYNLRHLIFIIEIVSIALKALICKIKVSVNDILIIDEGIPNMLVYYLITAIRTKIWYYIRVIPPSLLLFLSTFKKYSKIIINYECSDTVALSRWLKRGNLQSIDLALSHYYYHKNFLNYFINKIKKLSEPDITILEIRADKDMNK